MFKPSCLALACLFPAMVLAQAPPATNKVQAAKPAAKPAPAATTKPAAKPVAKAPAQQPSSRTEIRSTANQMAAGIMAAEAALSPEELAIAERVYVGRLPCELGAFVELRKDEKNPGYFTLQLRNLRYRMVPVATTTGAIRLEDQRNGAVWLQLINKSMLMNQKLGQRQADECMSPDQVTVAEALKKTPAPSLLDAPQPVVPMPVPASEATQPQPAAPETPAPEAEALPAAQPAPAPAQ